MFRIGEFSRFSRVTVKMLRNYARLGLLVPAWVDPETGYRYYAAEQLARLNQILALKELGFRLQQIGLMLDGELSDEQLHAMLRSRQSELADKLQRATMQLKQVEARLTQVAPALPAYEVVLRSLPEQRVAAIRGRTAVANVADLFEELEAVVAQHAARAPLPPLMLYHDTEYTSGGDDIEVLVPIQRPIPAHERVTTRTLASLPTAACLIHTGGYGGLTTAFSALLHWIEQNEYEIAGATREVYLRFGADQVGYRLPDVYLTRNQAEFVTELQLPISKKEKS